MKASDLESLFVTQPDKQAAQKLCTEICRALRQELSADLAMVFIIQRKQREDFFVPFATHDSKERDHPDASIGKGLLGVSYQRGRPVLVRKIRATLAKSGTALRDEFGDQNLDPDAYYNFDSETDEDIVIPLFSSDGHCHICGMVNIERRATRSEEQPKWTRELVERVVEQVGFLGHVVNHAINDDARRQRLRELIESNSQELSLNLSPAKARQEPASANEQRPDLLILTALGEELNEAKHAFDEVFGKVDRTEPTHYEGLQTERFRLTVPCGDPVSGVFATPRDMGFAAIGIAATRLFETLRPRIAIMCGIAGGAEADSHGDVLIASSAGAYRMGRLNEDGQVSIDGIERVAQIPPQLRTSLEDFAEEFTQKHQPSDRYSVRPRRKVNARCGPMGSSDVVLDSTLVMDHLRNTYARKLLGVEMEIYPFYLAASVAGSRPLAFACKATSDIPGHKQQSDRNSPQLRRDAMYISGWFAASYVKSRWSQLSAMSR